MDVFASPAFDEHEQVVFFFDPPSGLKAIVALHDTSLGPALGGCRMWPYPSEAEALTDVLRLAKGMTYKAAMAGLPFGGGKTVIIGDPRKDKSKALFRALGRAIESLGGRYYTGEDVGTTPADMDWAGAETAYVLGRSSGSSGDLDGIRVAVQGLGHVGYNVARLLAQDGARLIVADLDPTRAERAADEFGARPVDSDAIFEIEAEVLAPCALGGVINDDTLPRLTCRIVAGAANNQLLEPRHGAALRERGILYAPDYVINAGGLINIAEELRPTGYDRGRVLARVETIGETLTEVFERAEQANAPTSEIADRLAEERLRKARQAAGTRSQRDMWPAREVAPARAVAGLVAG